MTDRLVKEVITTTTERFNDGGNIKEKITETREKVYETKFSKEQVDNAKVVVNEAPKKQEIQNQQALSNEELIKQVGEKLDTQEAQPQQEVAQQQQPTQPGPFTPYQAPQYNVANRAASPLGGPQPILPPKMPWEK